MEKNWKEIEKEYISTSISLDELAKKHSVSKSMLYKKSSAGKWTLKKKKLDRKVEEKFIEKASSKKATEEVKKLERLIKAADKMAIMIEKAMEDPEQFNRYLVQRRTKSAKGAEKVWMQEEKFQKMDARSMRELTLTMKELTGLIRNLNGIPTEIEDAGANQVTINLEYFDKMGE